VLSPNCHWAIARRKNVDLTTQFMAIERPSIAFREKG
jgi:hypothetical protein